MQKHPRGSQHRPRAGRSGIGHRSAARRLRQTYPRHHGGRRLAERPQGRRKSSPRGTFPDKPAPAVGSRLRQTRGRIVRPAPRGRTLRIPDTPPRRQHRLRDTAEPHTPHQGV